MALLFGKRGNVHGLTEGQICIERCFVVEELIAHFPSIERREPNQ